MDNFDVEMPANHDADNTSVQMVGKTNFKVFWGVLLISALLLAFISVEVSSGAVAMAANLPIPFTITADTLNGTNFHLYPGVSSADNTTPVAINQMDATLVNQVITKNVQILGRTVTIKLAAGTESHPVVVTGLTTDVSSLSASSASFHNLVLNTAPGYGFDQRASTVTLNNVTISSPYLSANSITLPGLSLTLAIS
ncbi:MAG TPA: DUF6230 family protein [Dictyobacter sp.]|jgi:hypothetical protein|nr:DUF6230 family protein [Dictyobacter sp.]